MACGFLLRTLRPFPYLIDISIKKGKKKRKTLKKLSQVSLSDITIKGFTETSSLPQKSETKTRPKELCKYLYMFVCQDEDSEHKVAILLEIIAMIILKLLHIVLVIRF